MAEDLAALVIRLSAEGSEKVQKDISAIGANTKVTTDILMGMNNTLKKIERSGLIGLRNEFTKTQTASAQLSDQIKTQQATITALQNKLKTLGSEQVATTRATKDHTAEIEKHGKGIRNLIPHVALVTLSYMAMRRAVKAVVETLTIGASFEHQMSIVGGIVRATTEEFDALSKAALKAGEETVWTATEAANALRYLGMAGLGTEDAIAALGGVLNLALIGEMNLSRATDIATDSLMAFGLKATELDKVVDVFVGTITRSNTNIEALGQAMKFAAPVASQLGYSIEQVSAMIGILSQSGIKAGIAGRALRMSLLRSADAAKELGLSSSNLIEILKELSDRNLAPDELAATMHKLFGIEATPSMLILMKNVAALEEFIDTLNNSAGETDAFIKRLDTVTVAWKEVASVIEDLAITAFLKYADSLRDGLKDLKSWIGDHKEDILELFDTIVATGKAVRDIVTPLLELADVLITINKWIETVSILNTIRSIASESPAFGPSLKLDDLTKVGAELKGIMELVKSSLKFWKDFFSLHKKGFDELAEEYDVVKPKVNALAVEVEELYEAVRIEAEEMGKAAIANDEFQKTLDTHAITAYKNAMAELSQLKWYELLPESDQKTDEIARLKSIADYEKQVVDELKSLWGGYYYQNEEKFKELTKHKVDAFTKLYDTQKSNTEKIKDIEDKYTQEAGELLSKFTDETYKQEILKQVNLYRESQISRLQATGEASDEAVKIAEETTKRGLEILKEGLKNQKDSEKWFLDSKKELYKDDVAEQLKMLDEAYANYLNTHEDSLEAFEAYHAMRTKIYADAYKDEANALDTAMAEESKWMDGRIDPYVEFEKSKKKYRNDELQAMKSLYDDLGKISGEYYAAQIQIIELQAEKYIESLHLQGKAYEEMTAEQKALFDAVQQWKMLKVAEETVKMLRATGDWVDGVKAYLLQSQIDWLNYSKKTGDYVCDSLELMSEAAKNILSDAMKGDFENVKDLWNDLLDNLLDRFTDFIADIIVEWAKVQFGKLVLNIGTSGAGSFLPGGASGGSGLMGTILSGLSKGSLAYGLLSGETFASTLSSIAPSLAEALGVGMSEAAVAEMGALTGGSLTTGMSAGGIGAGLGTLAQGGIMGALAAAWAIGASALGEALMGGPDASITAKIKLQISETFGKLFDINIESIVNQGFDEGDAQNALKRIVDEFNQTLGAYEGMFSFLSDESQKELKDSLETINWDELRVSITQWARDGAPIVASTIFGNLEDYVENTLYNFGEVPNLAQNITNWINGGGLGGSGSVASSLSSTLANFFAEYVEEALDGIKNSDIFQYLTDELQDSINNADMQQFIEDFDSFFENVGQHLNDIKTASDVWEKLNRWVDGVADKTTQMDVATSKTTAYVSAYVAQMEALGVVMSEQEISDFTRKIANQFFEDLIDPAGFARPLSASDMLTLQINAAFDAYIARLKELGVDVEKIADLEAMRAAIIEREIALLEKQTNMAIKNTVEKWSGQTMPLENTLAQLNADFAEVYAALESVFGIADYSAEIAELEKQLAELRKEETAEIEAMKTLIESLKSGDVGAVTDYFDAVLKDLKKLIGSDGDFAALATEASGAIGAAIGDISTQAALWESTGEFGAHPFFKEVSEFAEKLKTALTDLSLALKVGDISSPDFLANFDATITALEEYIASIDKALGSTMAWEQPTYMLDALESAKAWAESMVPILSDFRDELERLQGAAGDPALIKYIEQILADLGQGDTTSALEYLEKKLAELQAGGTATADEIQALIDQINDLKDATEKYIAMQEKQLFAMKVQMGLIDESHAQFLKFNEIMGKLKGIAGMEDWTPTDWIEWFKTADLEAVKAMAQSLGIEWEELAGWIGFLIGYIDTADESIKNLIDGLDDMSNVWKAMDKAWDDFKEKYNNLYADIDWEGQHSPDIYRLLKDFFDFPDEITQEWLDQKREWLKSLSMEQLEEMAALLGISVQELVSDFLDLQAAMDAVEEQIKRIKAWQDDLLGRTNQGAIEDFKKKYHDVDITGKYIQDLIAWVGKMSAEELQRLADLYGVTVKDLMADISALVDTYKALEEERKSISQWQASLVGQDSEWTIAYFKKKYQIPFDITEDWLKTYIQMIASMSVEAFQALAAAMGVSTQELMDDINALMDAFDYAADKFANIAQQIRDIMDSIRADINGLMGTGQTAETIAGEINTILGKNLNTLTIEEVLGAAQLMQDWYQAAVKEAQELAEKQKEAIQVQIDAKNVELEELRLELQVVDRLESLVDSIEDTIKSIKYSDLNVALPFQKADEAKKDYAALLLAAQTGGTKEVQEYLSFTSEYLSLQQAMYKSSEAYQQEYNRVMADLEGIKSKAEAGGYNAAILAEIKNTNAAIEALEAEIKAMTEAMNAIKPDYTAIEEQFNAWATQIESLITQLEGLQIILNINWTNYTGTMEEALKTLMDLVAIYGWEDEITLKWMIDFSQWIADLESFEDQMAALKFVAGEAGWDSQATLLLVATLAKEGFDSLEEVMDMLNFIVAETGWDSQATLSFIANLNMDSFKTFEDKMSFLEFLVGETGWGSEATLTFMSQLATDGFDSFDDLMDTLQFVAGEAGWDSEAMIQLMGNLNLEGFTSLDDTMKLLQFTGENAGWDSEAMIQLMGNLNPEAFASFDDKMKLLQFTGENAGWDSDAIVALAGTLDIGALDDFGEKMALLQFTGENAGWNSPALATLSATLASDWDTTWAEIKGYLDEMNVDPAIVAQLGAEYNTAGVWGTWDEFLADIDAFDDLEPSVLADIEASFKEGEWGSLADVQAALAALDITDPQVIADIEAQWKENATFADWDAVQAALTQLGTPQSVIETIGAEFDALGSDLSLEAFENLMTAAGLSPGDVLEILNHVDGEIEIEEADVWKAQVALLVWIGENTWEIAKQLGSPYSNWNQLKAFAPFIMDWAPFVATVGLLRDEPTGLPLPVTGGTGGTCNFPAGITNTEKALDVYVKNAALTGGFINAKMWGADGLGIATYNNALLVNPHTDFKNRLTTLTDHMANIRWNLWSQNINWHPAPYAVIKTYAEGGIIDTPTYSLIGEAGYPEAVVPMPNGINIPVKWMNGGSTQAGTERPLHITVEVAGKEFYADVQHIARVEADEIRVKANKRKTVDTRRIYT